MTVFLCCTDCNAQGGFEHLCTNLSISARADPASNHCKVWLVTP